MWISGGLSKLIIHHCVAQTKNSALGILMYHIFTKMYPCIKYLEFTHGQ